MRVSNRHTRLMERMAKKAEAVDGTWTPDFDRPVAITDDRGNRIEYRKYIADFSTLAKRKYVASNGRRYKTVYSATRALRGYS